MVPDSAGITKQSRALGACLVDDFGFEQGSRLRAVLSDAAMNADSLATLAGAHRSSYTR
jgi:hypothetical protein